MFFLSFYAIIICMFGNFKKFITANLISLLGFILFFAWVWQLITLGHSEDNWFAHPIFTLMILEQQTLIFLGMIVLFVIECCIKKLTKHNFEIHSKSKFYDFLFRLGILFLVLPFFTLGTAVLLIPLTKFLSMKIYVVIVLIAVIVELFFLCKFVLFKKIAF